MDERIPSVERSPVNYKMRLGSALSDCRKAAGLRRADAAKALDCSEDKISRIEQGRVGVSERDLEVLLELYRVAVAERAELSSLASDTRQRKSKTPWGSAIPGRLRRFFDLESTAVKVRSYQERLIPGLAQTEDYARAVISANKDYSPETVERLVQARMARRGRLDGKGLELSMVLPESITRAGQPSVMRGQIRHLVELAQQPNVSVLVIPDGGPPYEGMGFSFVLMETPTRPIVYVETWSGDALTFETPDRLQMFESAWRGLLSSSLSADESVRLLDNAAVHL